MAKKKLLSEAQVRRFMSLSGIHPLNEMGGMYEDEPVADDEMLPGPDDELPEPEADAELPAPADAEDEKTVSAEKIDEIGQSLESALEFMEELGYMPGEAGEELPEPEGELPEPEGELPEPEGGELPAPEEEGEEDLLGEVELDLSEDEIVQEVARRVSRRILKAKKAQKELNNALGKK